MATVVSVPRGSRESGARFSMTASAVMVCLAAVAACQGTVGNDVSRSPGGSSAPGATPPPASPPVATPPVASPPVTPPTPPPSGGVTPQPPVGPPETAPTPPPVVNPPPVVMNPPEAMPPMVPPVMNPPAPPAPPAPPPPPAAPPVGMKRIAFVIGDVDDPSVGDDDLVFMMQNAGFFVEVADDNDRSRDFAKAGLVVISSSVNANQVNTEWDTVQPVIVLNSDVFSRMGMTANGGGNAGQQNARQLEIVDAKHPIATGRTGRITIADENGQMNFGAPGPAATIIATVNNDRRRAAIFAYDAGDQLVGNNRTAKNRRVGFFLRDDATETLRNDGATLFEAAVKWTWDGGGAAAAPTPGAPTPPTNNPPPAPPPSNNPGSGY